MPCSICKHPKRHDIDLALIAGSATLAALGQQYHLSTSALHRHKQHVLKKVSQTQNRFHDLLRASYLFMLNTFLGEVWDISREAEAAGNVRLHLQAIRQGTAIMKFMAKLDGSLTDDTVHRLLATPKWAPAGSLLPTDPQFLADCRQALADSLLAPCPEDPAPEDLDLLAHSLPGLPTDGPSQPAIENHKPKTANRLAKREKGGKLPGNTPNHKRNNEESQADALLKKIAGITDFSFSGRHLLQGSGSSKLDAALQEMANNDKIPGDIPLSEYIYEQSLKAGQGNSTLAAR